ncbi:MAG: hypothetical protein Q4A98_06000 [Comamonadaceae bacterium]|nr:hypothetical protein [Comamonadaceae bacterium]
MQITIHTLNIHLTPQETTLGAALVKAALEEGDKEQPEEEQSACDPQACQPQPQPRVIGLPPEMAARLAEVIKQTNTQPA